MAGGRRAAGGRGGKKLHKRISSASTPTGHLDPGAGLRCHCWCGAKRNYDPLSLPQPFLASPHGQIVRLGQQTDPSSASSASAHRYECFYRDIETVISKACVCTAPCQHCRCCIARMLGDRDTEPPSVLPLLVLAAHAAYVLALFSHLKRSRFFGIPSRQLQLRSASHPLQVGYGMCSAATQCSFIACRDPTQRERGCDSPNI